MQQHIKAKNTHLSVCHGGVISSARKWGLVRGYLVLSCSLFLYRLAPASLNCWCCKGNRPENSKIGQRRPLTTEQWTMASAHPLHQPLVVPTTLTTNTFVLEKHLTHFLSQNSSLLSCGAIISATVPQQQPLKLRGVLYPSTWFYISVFTYNVHDIPALIIINPNLRILLTDVSSLSYAQDMHKKDCQ